MARIKALKKKLPFQPFYLSGSEEVNIDWCNNFHFYMPTLGVKYGVPEELRTRILTCNKVLVSINDYETILMTWLAEWRDTKNMLMYEASSPSPIDLPAIREDFPALPPPVVANIFTPYIQAANIILANPDLTEADRNTLRLVKAQGKPVPPGHKKRETAEQFNYPLLKAVVKNGVVTIKVTRGNRFKGKSILIQVDRLGQGVFVPLINTSAVEVTDAISLPSGVLTASWTYRGIYIDGNTQLSDWSPNLYVSVASEPLPIQPEASPNLQDAVNNLNTVNATPQMNAVAAE